MRVHLVARLCLALAFAAVLSAPALADFDSAVRAYDRAEFSAALNEFRPMAEAGHAGAQFYIALLYDKGQALEADPKTAADWYRKSAEQGYRQAQFNLAVMYIAGEGVAKDLVEGCKWLTVSNYVRARYYRDRLYSQMSRDQVEEAGRRAYEWRPKRPKG